MIRVSDPHRGLKNDPEHGSTLLNAMIHDSGSKCSKMCTYIEIVNCHYESYNYSQTTTHNQIELKFSPNIDSSFDCSVFTNQI